MAPRSLRNRAWALAGISCALAVVLLTLAAPPGAGWEWWGCGILPWLWLRHGSVTVWRKTSVLLCAGLLASLVSHALWAVFRPAPLVAFPWVYYILPWPGHLLAWATGRLWPGSPVFVRGSPVRLDYLRAVARWTPGLGLDFRPAPDDGQGQAPPRWRAHDLEASFATPKGRVLLRPESSARGMSREVKRSLDVVLVVALAPLWVLGSAVGIVIVGLGSGWPLLYSQERVTLGGHRFRIWKLRTMGIDAEPGGVPVWPEENDPRITAPGRWLRRFWIDELPQAWNVLVGDLSWVGPRPERPHFVQAFQRTLPNYPMRHQVLAGITGLAQVMGFTGNTSLLGRLRSDLLYLRRWTPFLDARILLATAGRALLRPPIRKVKAR